MELRRSGKVAVGIIAALGAIGALHIFIFRSRAATYQTAKVSFDEVRTQYESQGSAPGINVIQKFSYITAREKLQYWQTLKGLNIVLPDFYATGSTVNPLNQHHTQLWDFLHDLERRRDEGDSGNGPKLTFVNSPKGWALANSLPKGLIDRNIAVEDEMVNLTAEYDLLQSLGRDTETYQKRQATYTRLLARLGLDLGQREQIKQNMGEFAATIYTLNRIDQVMKKLPDNYFVSTTEEAKLDKLYALFRIEWPKDTNGNDSVLLAAKQAEGITELLEDAKLEKVEEVSYLKTEPQRNLNWEDPTKAAAAAAAALAQPSVGDYGMNVSIAGENPTENYGYGMAEGGGEGGFGGTRPMATPASSAELVAYGAPVQILVSGPNAVVTSYLYRVSHSPNPYELDQLRIQSMGGGGGEGKVRAMAYVNIVGLAAYTLSPAPLTEIDIDRKIVETEIQLAELATKPGARDLAAADGVVTQQGSNWILAKPSPTPYPTPVPTPEPPPAPAVQ
ncbi:hypothetical protein BH09SUM1_BH09SUM1_03630 [soil metagenome]